MNWKTSKELKKELHSFVLNTADELIKDLKNMRNNWKIKSNKKELCSK